MSFPGCAFPLFDSLRPLAAQRPAQTRLAEVREEDQKAATAEAGLHKRHVLPVSRSCIDSAAAPCYGGVLFSTCGRQQRRSIQICCCASSAPSEAPCPQLTPHPTPYPTSAAEAATASIPHWRPSFWSCSANSSTRYCSGHSRRRRRGGEQLHSSAQARAPRRLTPTSIRLCRARALDGLMTFVRTPLQSIANAQSCLLPAVRFVLPTASAGIPLGALQPAEIDAQPSC